MDGRMECSTSMKMAKLIIMMNDYVSVSSAKWTDLIFIVGRWYWVIYGFCRPAQTQDWSVELKIPKDVKYTAQYPYGANSLFHRL